MSQTKIMKSSGAPLADNHPAYAIASEKQPYTPGRAFHEPVAKCRP
ncbi:MAG: hypothetical protein PHO37_10650 [Kiritimatiellae bacterium]|nr:hypothetical protein [Kiritimatiellia bacterium]